MAYGTPTWRRCAPGWNGRSAPAACSMTCGTDTAGPGIDMEDRAVRPLVIVGATGTLGNAFARMCDVRGLPYHILTRAQMNLADPRSVDRALEQYTPWALVNAAGYVRVDDAEDDP